MMNDVRLRHLISLWLDDAIEPDDRRALLLELNESESARRVYLSAMSINAELINVADGKRYLDQVMAGPEPVGLERPSNVRPPSLAAARRRPFLISLAVAASVMLAGGPWLGSWIVNSSSVEQVPSFGAILSKVRPASSECRWYVEHIRRAEPETLQSGDIIRVAQGQLELSYANGVKVMLEAPAAYQLISDMKSRMLLGHLTAEVSEAGRGFSVITPRATVIDLGTKFSVNVNDDGATDVVVFKGEVDVDYLPGNDESLRAQRLQMGEAVRLDAAGTASRIVSINNRSYSSSPLGAAKRPVIITEVRDNIERMSSLNYYEIVHEGMGEDALAYVDREAHQWNGIDAKGMPPYLLAGDYVKTFNNDKFNHDIRIGVTLAVPAKLYILLDNRLPIPKWLKDSFRDTGDDIGMDTGPFFSKGAWHNPAPPGIGPGESVEDTFSVWERVIPNPDTVYLGATEAPKLEPNMYGIVAVPLGETN
jgi:hypothetical protein